MLLAALCVLATGCGGTHLVKPANAVSAALAPVVDQATAAYQAANDIHDLSEDYDAATEFDKPGVVYNPRTVEPLLTDAQIDARLAVLKGLQLYVHTIVSLSRGGSTTELDAAAKEMGANLVSLGNAEIPTGKIPPSIITTPTDGTPPAISPDVQNILSTGVDALGRFLMTRKIDAELPGQIAAMDPHIQALCKLLADEVGILESQEKIDFDSILNRQTLFLRTANLDPGERREQIMKLPGIARQAHAAHAQLEQLKDAVETLRKAHSDLAEAARTKTPETFKSQIENLAAAGSSLGKFYSSLSEK